MKKLLFTTSLLACILFIDYLILIAVGCSAFKCGAQEGFYCGFYCKFALSLITLSVIGGFYCAKKLVNNAL
ncbi:hypothetical protein [Marinifilum flexuosum]|uniref:Uncharacterized protein n=1 Tax=Marinifilum flexuosum TaxID=1117708 RepID=A0A419XAS0_9BACT|nr:hypothetical protein [Marinifilum flexuosum]RKE04863.1 hypothetical protein BXY64_1894 [Marinifilum flexuosum]